MERKGIREQQQPPKPCPRCESTDTKFCYYNNYSQSQPRHYCKACRRYWTEGGKLRNVPRGGGTSRRGSGRRQKNKATSRSSTSPTASASAAAVSMPAGPADSATLSAGPEGPAPSLPPPPSAPLLFMGGGLGEGLMGLQGGNRCSRFHSGAGIMVGLGDQTAMMPLMLPPEPPLQGFMNFSVPRLQQNLLPPGTMVHPSTPLPASAAVFTAAGPSASVTAASYDGEELGFWNVFGSGGGSSGVPPPPTSSAPF